MNARRCSLSVPGSSERMLLKTIGLEVDEVIADLEDSVAAESKEPARELVGVVLEREESLAPAVAVRINALDGPWGERDVVELVLRAGPQIASLIVPKVERAEDIAAVAGLLDRLGDQAAGVRIQALAVSGHGHATRGALQQRRADKLLERLQALGDRRLAEMQSLRRAADPAEIGGCAEGAQLVQLRAAWG